MALPALVINRLGLALAGSVMVIISGVVNLEGGHVDHPSDPGGETNHGITYEVARRHGWQGPMVELPIDFATNVYFTDYVQKPGFLPLVQIQPAVAEKLIDASVNVGPARPSRWLQTSLNALNRGGRDYPSIEVDGKVGPSTIGAYKELERVRGHVLACQLTIKLLDAHQTIHYVSLTHLNEFTVGWITHRIGNVPLDHCSDHSRYRYVFEDIE